MTIRDLCQKGLSVRTGVCVCVCVSCLGHYTCAVMKHAVSISHVVTVADWRAEASRHDSVNVASRGSLPLTKVGPTCLPR
jgi:hypothetical protein